MVSKMTNIVEILGDLVGINTANPPGNEKGIVDYITKRYGDYFKYDVINHTNERCSLHIGYHKDKELNVGLVGHIDTVQIGNLEEWNSNPFQLTKIGEDIYAGRGVSDMKSGVTVMLMLLDDIKAGILEPEYNLDLYFTAGEEVDGLGVKKIFAESRFNHLDLIFVPEPTSACLGLAEKGAIWADLIFQGSSAHGSMPEKGVNAIDRSFSFISELRDWYFSKDNDHSLLGKSTLSLNKISGGYADNIVPDMCELTIDIRNNPSISNEIIIEKLNKMAEEYSQEGCGVEVFIKTNRSVIETNTNSPVFQKIMTKIDQDLLKKPIGINYYTDASDIVPKLNIPFVIYGPGYNDQCHVSNEKVSINLIQEVYEEYKRILGVHDGK